MPRAINHVLTRRGFAPAQVVATRLGKSLSSVHRMVADGRFSGARDGRLLYLDLNELITYFTVEEPNEAFLEVIKQLQVEYAPVEKETA